MPYLVESSRVSVEWRCLRAGVPKYASYPAELSRVSMSCIYNHKERGRGIANIRRIFLEPELSGVYRLLERVGGVANARRILQSLLESVFSDIYNRPGGGRGPMRSQTRVSSCRAF